MKITDTKQQCFQLSDTVCIADGHQHVTVFNFTLAELEMVLLSVDPSSESASTFCFSFPPQAHLENLILLYFATLVSMCYVYTPFAM